MPPRVIHEFVTGKKTGPDADPTVRTVVVAVPVAEVGEFLGTRTARERTRHLRALRQLDMLVHEPGRLTQRVVTGRDERGYPRTRRCCVFRAERTDDVPLFRRRREPRISYW